MKAQLVYEIEIDGRKVLDSIEVELENADVAFGARGYNKIGFNFSRVQRAELQGMPKFSGLCGPMYGGEGVVRYECPKAYARLSA